MKKLLEAGADMKARDEVSPLRHPDPSDDSDFQHFPTLTLKNESTPLHAAAAGGDPMCVRMLLAEKAPVDIRGWVSHAVPLA